MAEFDTSGLLEYFLQEAEEHINTLERGITNILQSDRTQIEELFRAAHTLKGASALVKLNSISRISHKMEDVLEELKDGKRTPDRDIEKILLYTLDSIKALIKDVSLGKGENPEIEKEISGIIDRVLSREKEPVKLHVELINEKPESPIIEKREVAGRRRDDIELFSGNFIKINIQKIENIMSLIGEVTIKKNYLLERIKKAESLLYDTMRAGSRLLKEVKDFSERYSYSLPGKVKYVDPLLAEFGELEFDRYDDLNLFSRKLEEMINDISESFKELGEFFSSFSDELKGMDNMVKLMRGDISELRMIEIGRLFQRFVRPVKEMAEHYGKKIELRISGGDTKVDKVIFERLFDPLMHIIRNAVIHGIEKPDERRQKGKKEEGVILLSARREGTNVYIEVHDNGRGIATYKIFEQAKSSGILKPDDKPSKKDLLSMIFLPGFTTTEVADMGSGRGMGLSAVRNMIGEINGLIEVDTEVGMGTTFTIKVPSSIAIINAIIFSAQNIDFAIPLSFVEEVTEIVPAEDVIKGFKHRGSEVIIKDLSKALGIREGGNGKNSYPLIIINLTDRKAGLIVDFIRGQEETIIKPMNKFLSGLSIYSGTSISGDGKVRLVINPLRLFEQEIKPLRITSTIAGEDKRKKVLVVDDSLSVRKYLTQFLESKDINVITATNGQEALDVLEEKIVDLIITDLEMPVMHGYELIHRIKTSERLRKIPVVVLTSRSAEKHRMKALSSGVEDYIVKPFEEQRLTEVLRKYIQRVMV